MRTVAARGKGSRTTLHSLPLLLAPSVLSLLILILNWLGVRLVCRLLCRRFRDSSAPFPPPPHRFAFVLFTGELECPHGRLHDVHRLPVSGPDERALVAAIGITTLSVFFRRDLLIDATRPVSFVHHGPGACQGLFICNVLMFDVWRQSGLPSVQRSPRFDNSSRHSSKALPTVPGKQTVVSTPSRTYV